jgi:hypothetical protein
MALKINLAILEQRIDSAKDNRVYLAEGPVDYKSLPVQISQINKLKNNENMPAIPESQRFIAP